MKGRNAIVFEVANGSQPFVVYWIKGKARTWRAAFSTESLAQAWIDTYGDRPPADHMA